MHFDPPDDPNRHYRRLLSLDGPGAEHLHVATGISADAVRATLVRVKNSYRGIGQKSSLRVLVAHSVNQPFLEELCGLEKLTHLELEYPTTAGDLMPLVRLRQLKVLKINSPRAIADFTPILQLPALETLFIENAQRMASLEWLRPLSSQLAVLGIEGSMWTPQRIPSLEPLTGFSAQAIFLTSTRIADGSLRALQTMPNLRFIGIARNASRQEFQTLSAARPDVICDWFRDEMWSAM